MNIVKIPEYEIQSTSGFTINANQMVKQSFLARSKWKDIAVGLCIGTAALSANSISPDLDRVVSSILKTSYLVYNDDIITTNTNVSVAMNTVSWSEASQMTEKRRDKQQQTHKSNLTFKGFLNEPDDRTELYEIDVTDSVSFDKPFQSRQTIKPKMSYGFLPKDR
jgi:hypothetical protein